MDGQQGGFLATIGVLKATLFLESQFKRMLHNPISR